MNHPRLLLPQWNYDGDDTTVEVESMIRHRHQAAAAASSSSFDTTRMIRLGRRRRRRREELRWSHSLPSVSYGMSRWCHSSTRRVTGPTNSNIHTITTITRIRMSVLLLLLLLLLLTMVTTTHAWVVTPPYSSTTATAGRVPTTTTTHPARQMRRAVLLRPPPHGHNWWWSQSSASDSFHHYLQMQPVSSNVDDSDDNNNDASSYAASSPPQPTVIRRQQRQRDSTKASSSSSRFAQPQFQTPPRPSASLESQRRRQNNSSSSSSRSTPPVSSSIATTTTTTTTPIPPQYHSPPPPPLPFNDRRRSSSTTNTALPSPHINRDRMWKRPTTNNNNENNNKNNNDMNSIDALEQRLMRRYGTDLSPWTSGEFDDDDDDDDGDDSNDNPSTTTQSPTVFDPWQDDDDNNNNDDDTFPKPPKMDRRRTTSTTANTNTNTNTESSTSSATLPKSPLAAFGRRHVPPPPPQSTAASATTTTITNQAPFDLSHLIASKPVGGRGTLATPLPNPRVVDDEQRPAAMTMTQPIRDAQGVPIFLTVEQAQRLFEEQLEKASTEASFATTSSNETDHNHHHNVKADDVLLPTPTATWEDLGITNQKLLYNLKRMNCEYPLPAQRTSGPNIVSGTTDVIIGTYTGSGKTLAFLVPILQRILQQQEDDPTVYDQKSGYVKLIVVAPGRELASQIATVSRTLLEEVGLSCMLAIGGTTFTRNLEHIRKRKPDILIGTPGRLAELIIGTAGGSSSSDTNRNMKRGGRIAINNVQAIVLDEFDALLSYTPHSDPVRALMDVMKRHRGNDLQTIMCSATASDMMMNPQRTKEAWRDDEYLRPGHVVAMADANDILVTALPPSDDHSGTDTTTTTTTRPVTRTTRVSRTVMHGVVHVPHKRFALDTLRRILHTEPIPQQILIFVSDSRKVGIVVEKLANVGIIAAPLHGGMDSEKMDRAEVSRALREGYVGIVVSTEMAARGLDAPLLTHVINMDLPTDPSHYAHRAGRCGRGGRPGVVINLTTSPQERGVPVKFADHLGVTMYTVQVKNAKLNVIDPKSQIVDGS